MHHLIWSLSCLFLLFLFGCQPTEKPSVPPVGVTDYTVEPKNIPVVFDFVGFAESSHPVEIRARVEGYLDKIAYEEGRLVKEGELLFQLDPNQFQAKVEQAKGEVLKQEAILQNAILTVNRLTPLFEQKAASKKDLDNAVASKLSAEASLQSAKAQLLDAEINLGYTTIKSPITGYADRARYREGALISPGGNNLLTTVSVLDPIWIYFTISDNVILQTRKQENEKKIELPQLGEKIILPKENQYSVELVLSDGSIFPMKGVLNFSAPTYQQATGTLMARATFSNPIATLRPGQFVKVKVYGANRPNALFVPQRALVQKKNGMFVYLINENSTVSAQDVETGDWYGDYQIIMHGLKPGDRIVVDGIDKVRPGTKVKVNGHWKTSDSLPDALPAS